MYIPFFQPFFDVTPLDPVDWVVILIIGSVLIVIDEIRTFLAKRVTFLKGLAGYW